MPGTCVHSIYRDFILCAVVCSYTVLFVPNCHQTPKGWQCCRYSLFLFQEVCSVCSMLAECCRAVNDVFMSMYIVTTQHAVVIFVQFEPHNCLEFPRP